MSAGSNSKPSGESDGAACVASASEGATEYAADEPTFCGFTSRNMVTPFSERVSNLLGLATSGVPRAEVHQNQRDREVKTCRNRQVGQRGNDELGWPPAWPCRTGLC